MTIGDLLGALFLGLLEGFTEFIPVSSTAHILLAGHFLGIENNGHTFEVLVQLGAVLAIITVYFERFMRVAKQLPTNPGARRFVLSVVVAFLPAAFIGAFAHGFIKSVLFQTPVLICVMLILGGIVLLFIDRLVSAPRFNNAMGLPLPLALKIGFCQCVAMIPGVSRSGSTIVGAMLLGVDKRAAAEFSFFLALPTMLGAFTYDLYKNYANLTADDGIQIAIGFVAAFCAAVVVVRALLDFVSRHGYAPFGWWRIIVGTLGLVGLMVAG
ncbi:undecaprenyl-diphosphate phosphatase [Xanthobacter sp. TB0136]|uniref:undecaprenyl-diphosphate phosphatase n=1 Tax=Xanthobacter sp. TB0136 TaxID=3459177 RepID=UPI00403A20BD